MYHQICWEVAGGCAFCQGDEAAKVWLAPVLPTVTLSRQRPARMSPCGAVYIRQGREPVFRERSIGVRDIALDALARLRALVMAGLMISLAAVVSLIAWTIGQSWLIANEVSYHRAVDAVLSVSLSASTLMPALLGAIAAALAFYPRLVNAHGAPTRRVYVSSAAVLLVLVNCWFLDLVPAVLVEPVEALSSHRSFLMIQALGIVIGTMLRMPYRWLAPLNELPTADPSPLVANLYGWTRLILVSALLVSAWTLLVLQVLSHGFLIANPTSHVPVVTQPGWGVLAICLATAAVVYWSPGHRNVTWKLLALRTLVFLGGIFFSAWLLRMVSHPEDLVIMLVASAVITILSIPIQRVLS